MPHHRLTPQKSTGLNALWLGVWILLSTPVEAHAHGGELLTVMAICGGHFFAMVPLLYWMTFWPGPSGQRIGLGCCLSATIILSVLILVVLDEVIVWKYQDDPNKNKLEFLVSLTVPWICGLIWRAQMKKNPPPGADDDR